MDPQNFDSALTIFYGSTKNWIYRKQLFRPFLGGWSCAVYHGTMNIREKVLNFCFSMGSKICLKLGRTMIARFLSHPYLLFCFPLNWGDIHATSMQLVVKRRSRMVGLLTVRTTWTQTCKATICGDILIMCSEKSCLQFLYMLDIISMIPWASQPPPPKRAEGWWT